MSYLLYKVVIFVIHLLAAILPKLKLSGTFQSSSTGKELETVAKDIRGKQNPTVKEYCFAQCLVGGTCIFVDGSFF